MTSDIAYIPNLAWKILCSEPFAKVVFIEDLGRIGQYHLWELIATIIHENGHYLMSRFLRAKVNIGYKFSTKAPVFDKWWCETVDEVNLIQWFLIAFAGALYPICLLMKNYRRLCSVERHILYQLIWNIPEMLRNEIIDELQSARQARRASWKEIQQIPASNPGH